MSLRLSAKLWSLANGGFKKLYEKKVADGLVNFDERQIKVVSLFQDLADRMVKLPVEGVRSRESFFSSWLRSSAPRTVSPLCRGLYVFGGTGTGKTMLMDLWYENLEISSKKRVHFHGWLIDVHQRLHALQKSRARDRQGTPKSNGTEEDDLIERLANEMIKDARLLCFDEFQVTFISDAVIMRRLLTRLFEKGAVIVATSNRPPLDLYSNGLNRELFTPFIPIIEKYCIVHDMNSAVDYRMLASEATDDKSVYFAGSDEKTRRLFEGKFYRLARNETTAEVPLEIQGRTLMVNRAAKNSAIAWFSFKELCDKPLGAADYLSIARNFHTVFIEGIPKFTLQERDQMRRFITLVDALYDSKVRLISTAADVPLRLFAISDSDRKISGVMDEVFAWDRLVSRLSEMQSEEYLASHSRKLSVSAMFSQYQMTELTESEIEEIWHRYDVDNNGSIDESELKSLLEDLLEHSGGRSHVPPEVLSVAIKALDTNSDGMVSRDEFFGFVKSNGLTAKSFTMI